MSYLGKGKGLLGIQCTIEVNKINVGQVTCKYFKGRVPICNLRWKAEAEVMIIHCLK